MATILGLDLGSNSIGWAFVDTTDSKITAAGVRVFTEGVDNPGGAQEESKNAARRAARLTRRGYKRKLMKRSRLITLLRKVNMFPNRSEDIPDYYAMDPYELRRKGLYEELTPCQFGRVLLHINKRRGFLSNRKTDTKDDTKIFKGYEDKIGITETQEAIGEDGFKTLGEYLASLDPHEVRRRSRFTLRKMYLDEFSCLWNTQKSCNPNFYTDELKKSLEKIIFYQRPLKSQKHLVGNCSLEQSKKAVPKSCPIFQQFRILEQLSRIRITLREQDWHDRPLSDAEWSVLRKELDAKKELTFSRIRTLLNLPDETHINLEENGKLIGNKTAAQLEKVIGKSRWHTMGDEEKFRLWHLFYSAEDHDTLGRCLQQHWDVTAEQRDRAAKVSFEKEYGNYSTRALKKINPHIAPGVSVTEAVEKAGYIKPGMSRKQDRLPALENLRNPIVMRALNELRHVVNTVLDACGRPDSIRIELARDLRNSKKKRREERIKLLKRQREYEEIRERLKDELDFGSPTTEDVHKYRLWKECGEICPYTGKTISLKMLYSGEFEIEHIIPYSKSLDNSLFNKTLCHVNENKRKGNKTPYEAYAGDQQQYNEILMRVRKSAMNRGKQKLFMDTELKDDFIAQQLNDTRYISRKAMEYLAPVAEKVQAVKGGSTALLRYYWGLNSIVGDGDIKSRDDHRHHAVDAVVVALTDHKKLHTLSVYHKYGRESKREQYLPPWDNFRSDVDAVIRNIFVSHRFKRKTTGKLHEETCYGLVTTPDGDEKPVVRKPLENMTRTQLRGIVDAVVKQQVFARLESLGVAPDKKFTVPKDMWKEPLMMPDAKTEIKKARYYVRADPHHLKRLYEGKNLYVEPGSNHHIAIFESGSGKREGVVVTLFEAAKRVRLGKPVIDRNAPPGWTFVMSLSINEMVLLDIDETTIDWDDPKRAEQVSDSLFRVQKIDINEQIMLRNHVVARLKDDNGIELGRVIKTSNTLKCVKVAVDPIGRIGKAHG